MVGTRDAIQTFEWEHSGRPSTAVIDALAETRGCEPIKLRPLHTAVDCDALDDLFRPGTGPPNTRVWFQYEGFEIRIHGHGRGYIYRSGADVPIEEAS